MHYCNPWINATVDKIIVFIIAVLSLSLALTRSLQTLSYSDHALLDTKRSKRTLNSKILITENIIRDFKEYHILKRRCLKNFIHCALLLVRRDCVRGYSSDVHYCNPSIIATVDKNLCTYYCSTITITSTYEVVAGAAIFRSRFIRHKTIKTNTKASMGELENTSH